jgi:hypothetical protein
MKKNHLMIFLTTIILSVVLYGKYVEKTVLDSATSIYQDRLVPQLQLSKRFDYYGVTIKDNFTSKSVNVDTLLLKKKEILNQKRITDTIWVSYKKTFLTAKELNIVKQTDALMTDFDSYLANLFLIAKTKPKTVDSLIKSGELHYKVKGVLEKINTLIDLQTEEGKNETIKMREILVKFNNFMSIALALCVVLFGTILYSIYIDLKSKKIITPKKIVKKKLPTKKIIKKKK